MRWACSSRRCSSSSGQQLALAAEPAEPGSTSDYLVTFAAGNDPGRAGEPPRRRWSRRHLVGRAAAPVRRVADRRPGCVRYGVSAVTSVETDRVREVQLAPNDPAYDDQWALGKIGWDSAYGSVVPAGIGHGRRARHRCERDRRPRRTTSCPARRCSRRLRHRRPERPRHGHGEHRRRRCRQRRPASRASATTASRSCRSRSSAPTAPGQDSAIVEGVVYAADHGADVILMSFSNPGASSALQAAVDYAWSKGAVLVAATGNDGSTTASYPAGAAKVVGVSATDRDDTLWARLQLRRRHLPRRPRRRHRLRVGSVTGTSASAAIVAGVAALVRANDPGAAPTASSSAGWPATPTRPARSPTPATAGSTWPVLCPTTPPLRRAAGRGR